MSKRARVALLATITATATTAAAEGIEATQPATQTRGYIGVGAVFGAQRDFLGGVYIDGGKRLGQSPVFVRAQLTGGQSGDEGSFVQLRAGAEARRCVVRALVCGFFGLDAGYQRDQLIAPAVMPGWPVMELSAHDAMLIPRLGAEVGGKLRLRALVELPLYQRFDGGTETWIGANRGSGLVGSVAVAAAF